MIRFIANALLSPIHIIKILLQSIRGAVTPNIGSCGALSVINFVDWIDRAGNIQFCEQVVMKLTGGYQDISIL